MARRCRFTFAPRRDRRPSGHGVGDGFLSRVGALARRLGGRSAATNAVPPAPETDARQFRFFIESVVDYAIFTLDPGGMVTTWNGGAARSKGYAAEEIVGRHFSTFYTEADRAAGAPDDALRRAADGHHVAEGWRVRKDGSRFWASVVIDPVRDRGGTLLGFVKVTRDMSERKAAEEMMASAREQALAAQKMEVVGRLAGGVAHEFNNLLTVVTGNLDLLAQDVAEPLQRRRISAALGAAERGARLTRQMLSFGRRQTLRPERHDIDALLRGSGSLIGGALGSGITLAFSLEAPGAVVLVDPVEIEIAVVNVAINARLAMPGGGTFLVGSERLPAADASGERVRLRFTDVGTGMTPEVKARAFEPFFTTRDIGGGSGLGLSQVHGFAMSAGGSVSIESEPGRGTTIVIDLPLASRPDVALVFDASREVATADAGRAVAPMPAARGSRILLVEDAPDVLETVSALLEEAGFRVTSAQSGEDALVVIDRHGRDLDLVISDVQMPGGISGAVLAREIETRRPGLPVLLMTGYAEPGIVDSNVVDILRKPVGRDELVTAIGSALAAKRA